MTALRSAGGGGASAARERRTAVGRRSSVHFALAFGFMGAVLGAWLYLGVFHYQDRRPPEVLSAPEFGKTFDALSASDRVEARITIHGGERSTYRAAGGTDADHEYIKLSITIEAVEQLLPSVSGGDWHAIVGGEEVGFATVHVSRPGFLEPGQTTDATVTFSGIPTGSAVVLTYQGVFDDEPLLRIALP